MTTTMKKSEAEPAVPKDEIIVSAVMPCLNEELTLPLCIEKAQRAFREMGVRGEVVVADNGSTDRSVEVAEAMGARVVHESRKGYGAALMAGIVAAHGRIIVMGDSDDSYDWSAIEGFVRKIEEGFDLVMGNRFHGGIAPGAMPPLHRYLGNPVLSAVTRWLHGIPIGDFHCGLRAFTRSAFARMRMRTPGMEFATEMVINSARAGLRITEIPTRLYPDKRDRPPHLRSFRDGWRHLRFIITYAPDFLYLVPGALLLAFGLAGLAVLAGGPITIGNLVFGIHFLALASLLFLAGANLIIFGILAKTWYSHRHALPPSLFAEFLARFTLERGLLGGITCFLVGLGTDAAILHRWLARQHGDMGDTVHLAFIATTVMVLGIQVAFASFLLSMMRERH